MTRQAYLPVWFPEDTGIGDGGRKPCTLGYHFLVRNDRMHITYHIRSCDFVRHFRDDIYLTARLVWWMIDRLTEDHDHHFWSGVKPGMFVMHIASLHMFVNDYIAMFGKEPQ
jgi:thymidylate synthase